VSITARPELIRMYASYPPALEEEVAQVFSTLANDEQRIVHNVAVSRIGRLFATEPAQRLLWKNVANAILRTAVEGATDNGKDSKTA
jgi:hypothetical protein